MTNFGSRLRIISDYQCIWSSLLFLQVMGSPNYQCVFGYWAPIPRIPLPAILHRSMVSSYSHQNTWTQGGRSTFLIYTTGKRYVYRLCHSSLHQFMWSIINVANNECSFNFDLRRICDKSQPKVPYVYFWKMWESFGKLNELS